MQPIRLYIEDFLCHRKSFIDFTQFNSALIVGKINNSDLYSNGVGKTTIFKAIEYALFNQSDMNLEKIIRDDTNSCKIILDFMVDEQEYRIVRTRTRKGSSDLSLFQRVLTDDDSWKDISGRRAMDTEQDIEKLIGLNFKAFRSTVHFMQNDFSGLATATPEKRKLILKEVLNLSVYSKLEKIAKDKANAISNEIYKHKLQLENLGDPNAEITLNENKLRTVSDDLEFKKSVVAELETELAGIRQLINNMVTQKSLVENNLSMLFSREKTLLLEKSRLESSITDYTSKKSNINRSAKALIAELNVLKTTFDSLSKVNFSEIDALNAQIQDIKDEIMRHNMIVESNTLKYDELKIPIPNDGVCKHCRQTLTDEHRKLCLAKINSDIIECQTNIKNSRSAVKDLSVKLLALQNKVNDYVSKQQQLNIIGNQIATKKSEIKDKHTIFCEYGELLKKINEELNDKNIELASIKDELEKSSADKLDQIISSIKVEKDKAECIQTKINSLHKEIAGVNDSKAVIIHTILEKQKNLLKKEELEKSLIALENKFKVYPDVLQAFSSTGIPNLIIQNVLDDLQIEANNLLSQLKPGLQLSFFVEKTRSDGAAADTLDIHYYVNGKERLYDQLSGAMKLSVTFSLKLGVSFLLQKMFGTNIKFLLLDEIDQSLDKASVDAFADIVKFFQDQFTILVITHNDRLKEKFSHAILVDQDINCVSEARVVSSW
jgi:DNA repair exonuclease SbcCD ATPase subunit